MEAGHRTAAAEIHPRNKKKLARTGSLMEGDFVAARTSEFHEWHATGSISISWEPQISTNFIRVGTWFATRCCYAALLAEVL
jgi:hypothetical protein